MKLILATMQSHSLVIMKTSTIHTKGTEIDDSRSTLVSTVLQACILSFEKLSVQQHCVVPMVGF